jgi:hypothetical protein
MDGDRFDLLSRAITGSATRRATLGGVLGALLGTRAVPSVDAKGRRRKRQRGQTRACFAGRSCPPGAGQSNRECNFADSTVFRDLDARGANLRGANFANADLAGADLRGASLRDACLLNANLTGATIDGTTSLEGAIFCNTTMPDGSTRDSGCQQSHPCCPSSPPPGVGEAFGVCRVLFNPTRCGCWNVAANRECGWVPGYGCQVRADNQCRVQSATCVCQT